MADTDHKEDIRSLRFFESLDRINRAVQSTDDLDEMMQNVLDEVLDIFGCDRAFLLYPCDPDADSWSVPMERTKPEYPGAGVLKTGIPMDSEVADTLRVLLESNGVLKFGPGTDHPLPQETSERFGFKSFMSTALHPKTGKPWEFGIHQCSHDRIWTDEEARLLLEIGYSLADGLTSLLIMRDLRESERQFRSLAENTPDNIIHYDQQCRVTYFNPGMLQTLDTKPEVLLGKTPVELGFGGPELSADFERHIRQVLGSGQSNDMEIVIPDSEGSFRTHLVRFSAERNREGEIVGVLAIGRDITELKETEMRLTFSEEKFSKAFQASPNLMAITRPEDGLIIEINEAFCSFFGYTRDECIGHHTSELHMWVNPEQRDEAIRELEKNDEALYMQVDLRTKSGEIRSVIDSMLYINIENRKYLLSVATDITERKQTEEKLLQSEQRLRLHTELSPLGFLEWDENFCAIDWNPACEKIFGYTRKEALGRHAKDLILHPEVRELADGIYQDLMKQRGGTHSINENVTKDGRIITVEWFNTTLIDKEGKAIGVASVCRDITKLKQAEVELKERQEQLIESQRIGHMGSWYMDLATNEVFWSEELYKMYGYDPSLPPPLYTESAKLFTPESWERLSSAIAKVAEDGTPYELELEMVTKEGSKWMQARGELVRDEQEKPFRIRGVVLDITERKRHDAVNASRLHLIQYSLNHSLDDLLEETLNEAEKLTGSLIGFYHFVEEDQISLTLQNWSTRTKAEFCKAEGKGMHYPIDEAGVWVDCVHEGKAVIHNDYSSLKHRKGMPEGHAEVVRELVVPVFRGEKITAILGVGNKPTEYNDQDAETVSLIADLAWEIAERKKAEMELYRLNRELHAISNCNQALMKATDEQALLDDICNIICDEAGYRLAWVGYAENDEAKTIRPVAWAGEGSDYIADAKLSWSEELEHGRGPAGIVIRNGETIYVQDFEDSTLMNPWRQNALLHGYHSGIALPLKSENVQPFGALLIYSGEKNAISPDEIRLLEELAGDMAYGIANLRIRAENKLATEALAESEKLQRLLLDTLTQQVFYKDRDSRYIACNRTFAHGLGMEPKEIVGKSDFELYPQELAERYRADDLATMKSGETIDIEEPYEAGGEKFWVHTVKTPMRDATGEVTGVLGIFWDITAQRRAVQELERSESRLAEAQRIAKLGSWELNLVTDELTWSDELYEIFEIDKAEFGASYEAFLNAIHPEDRDMVDRAYTDSVRKHSDYEADYRLLMRDGSIKFAQAQGRTYYDAGDKPLRSVGTIQDISRLHDMEMQLRHAQKMEAVGTLVGGIAHDFNNKLAAITGNLYLAQRGVDAQSEIGERLKSVEKLSFEAADMVQQLLTFARKDKVEQHPVSLLSFIKEAAKLNRVAIPEDIAFSVDYGKGPLIVMGDITQLQQLFLNLLTNARDALEGVEKARIDVSLYYYEPAADFLDRHPEAADIKAYACIQVRDNGHGIAPEHLEQMFDPFFTTKEVGKGTGLGLAMVYGVVQSHRGIIEVESKEEQGSCFSIYLPIYGDTDGVNTTGLQREVVAGQGETILLADDDVTVLNAFADVLTSLQYRVLTARNGREAVELFHQHAGEVDLVILDIIMPEMKGPQVAEELRKIDPDVRLLFASGYDSKREKTDSDIVVLDKPFAMDKISRTIRWTLDS